jgi:CheY-like chemotaxis protein
MSHEIRTPLNGVMGMAELLTDMPLEAEPRRAAELILDSGSTLLRVINDILDYSRIEAGQLDVESVPLDLHDLVYGAVKIVTSADPRPDLEVIVEIDRDVPAAVIGDPTRVRQVLNNLIANAVKFTERGEVAVGVATAGASGIRFSVRDTGIGMTPETRQRIFEPFRQADASMTRRYGGTGLGLSISRRLVELMRGTIEVASQPGAGSTFTFTLPLPATAAIGPRRVPALANTRLLVVDDNATNLRVLQGMLEETGAAVEVAPDGEGALAAIHQSLAAGDPFAALVTDLQMPGMDGFTLVGQIRAMRETAELPVVNASSAARPGDQARARGMRRASYLVKPVARRELLEALAEVIHDSHAVTAQESPIGSTRKPMRLLLVEDNVVNQQVAAIMLRRRGHFVDIVDDGPAAIDAVARARYDVVLMDIQMPGMDGLDALALIRGTMNGSRLPVIAVTANALVGERERCLAAGMNEYVAKPYVARELFAAVERFAARQAA